MAQCQIIDKTAENSDGNRRVRGEVSVQRREILTSNDPFQGNKYTLEYYVHILGTPYKKNFWGSWVNYDTGNTLNSRFGGSITIREESSWPPVYFDATYSISISDTRSNDGYSIEYMPIIKTYYDVREYYIVNGWWGFSHVIQEGTPVGTYTSGGVPTGVELKCS